MAIRYIKEGKSALERSEDDAKVRQIVEVTLKDIETRGDAAAVSYTHLRAHET